METVKLSLKMGALEFDYEGSDEFLAESLVAVLEQVSALEVPMAQHVVAPVEIGSSVQLSDGSSSGPVNFSVSDIAVKLGAKSGSDLVMAAAANLFLTKGMETFRRQDILGAMKDAKSFYKVSYGSNLSKSLDMLIKSAKLQTPASDVFALPHGEAEAIKSRLR